MLLVLDAIVQLCVVLLYDEVVEKQLIEYWLLHVPFY